MPEDWGQNDIPVQKAGAEDWGQNDVPANQPDPLAGHEILQGIRTAMQAHPWLKDMWKQSAVPVPGELSLGAASGAAQELSNAIKNGAGKLADVVSPDIVGIFSPRVAHFLRTLGRLSNAIGSKEQPALFDEIAQGLSGKSSTKFADLDAKMQGIVQDVAKNMKAGKNFTPMEGHNQPAPSPAAPITPEPASAPAPAPAAPTPVAPATPPTQPQVTTIPFSKPTPPPEAFAGPARAKKAIQLAQALKKANISSDEAVNMTPDHWATVAKVAGVNKPSAISQQETLFRLRQMESIEQRSPELMQRLQQTGALPAALELQRLMGQP